MRRGQSFFSLYSHDFVRIGIGVPRVREVQTSGEILRERDRHRWAQEG